MRGLVLLCCLWFAAVASSIAGSPGSLAQGVREERELLRLPKSVSHLSWLNEKTLLATLTGTGYGNREIGLIDLATGDVAAGCLSWSPDGRRIAATVIAARARTAAWDDILIIAADTGRTEQAISDEDLRIGWATDSRLRRHVARFPDDRTFSALVSGRQILSLRARV